MRLYYIILSYRQLRSIAKWAGRSDGFFQTNFCYRLEGRAYALIYRTNMVTSMFTAIYLVETANVLVNKDLKVKPNTLMKIGDLLSFFETNFLFFRANFFSRIDSRGIYFSTPRYLFYSYKLNVFSMLALPQDRDLAFPMEFDIYRVSGYY